jgi:hypothetical protein
MTEPALHLASGLRVEQPLERLRRFSAEEYAYYDAIRDPDPDRITPMDILATVSMNSFVNSATKVRSVHGGMAANCDPLLPEIPVGADLRTFDIGAVRDLLDAACRARGVLVPVATKVLHRKRRRLVPMLDSVVIDAYRNRGLTLSLGALQEGSKAADAVMPVLEAFRGDLIGSWGELEVLRARLSEEGFTLTNVRLLEVLIWVQTEPRGYYRGESKGE